MRKIQQDIDVNAQRDWLAQKYDISEYSDEQIRKGKDGQLCLCNGGYNIL